MTIDPKQFVQDVVDEIEAEQAARQRGRQAAVDGGSFVFDEPEEIPAIWGDGDNVLWAEGESLFICGPGGVGKTTLSQRVILARIGLGDEVLGLPVSQSKSKVLYVAADRPRQAARSLKRMVSAEDAETLAERLVVWRGPLEKYITEDKEYLVRLCEELGCDTVVLDSLKDVALDISKDETGGRGNIALQATLAAGIEVLVLHHQRKADGGANTKPNKIDDVYGSVWFVNGAGSVVVLWGEAGDPIVELTHLKQPAEPVGPFTLFHDQTAGTMAVDSGVDAFELLRKRPGGLTARSLACEMFEALDPEKKEIAKARRKLEALVKRGHAHRREGYVVPGGGQVADTYFLVARNDPERDF